MPTTYVYQYFTKSGAKRYLNDKGNLTSKLASARQFSWQEKEETLRDGSHVVCYPGKFIEFPDWHRTPLNLGQLRALVPGFFKQTMARTDKKKWVVVVGEETFLLIHRRTLGSQGFGLNAWPVYKFLPDEKDLRFQEHLEDKDDAKEWRKSNMTPKEFVASKAVPI